MNFKRNISLAAVCMAASFALPAFAQYSGLTGFSEAFLSDKQAAEAKANQTKSTEPLIALLKRYTNSAEQAELEMSIGLLYNQRTGMVNPSNAVVHFTAALRHDLPEKAYIQIMMWRGNSLEQPPNYDEALMDYLRGLLACTYYDLSGGWPEIKPSNVPIFMNSPDPKNAERVRDYNLYRKRLDFQRFLLMQRYYFIEAVKRVRKSVPKGDDQIMEMLKELSPDSSRFGRIIEWLSSENKRPWP